LASNVLNNAAIPSPGRFVEILKTVTDAAQLVEQLLAATGAEPRNAGEIGALTVAFSNLAAIAIQAAHSVSGKEITSDSVMSLLPVSTPLVSPAG
jgi:hypothetical protein